MTSDEPLLADNSALPDPVTADPLSNDPLANDPLAPRLLYRDGMILVIDKPAGLPVHPGPAAKQKKIPTLTGYLESLRFGLPRTPEAAHRLDKDTSGCLVLGRHPKAIAQLNDMFRAGTIGKTYWAVVEGHPATDIGVIDFPLGRKNPDRGWWMKVDPDGLPSRTRFTVLGRSNDGPPLSWLELVPETGRTHQLRVHCEASGWPILGDPVYGNGPKNPAEGEEGCGLQLHARALTLSLSRNKPPLTVEAPVPAHMQDAMRACGWNET
jgi:tRNA pseudouridine32 synthase / 23S rRNA pseudouridine746 synthase